LRLNPHALKEADMNTQSQAVSSAGVQCGEERVYALNKLKKSPRNVRKVEHTQADIEARAASIKAKGVLQMPVVEPELRADGSETGYGLVTIGECRRLALRLLAKRKVISKTTPIRCLVDTVNDPQEISLDENVSRSANQIEAAYGANNAILDNCHVRVAFSTNDERTARRISDSLGTATELRAMKNYAGHRLSPWLGHLMVSRQETARPLLTPGEVMQLPPDEEVIQVSGSAPIRALKVRYYLDLRLAGRVAAPPSVSTRLTGPPDDWTLIVSVGVGARAAALEPVDEGGHRIEPELGGNDQNAIRPPEPEADVDLDGEGDEVQQAADLQRRFKAVARQAALDPDDGIAL